ncbi:MAG: hypothetical protein KDE32_15715 [Novosphingobium sp.]|nr:hypothetical protein [Novosphingobium sp.]
MNKIAIALATTAALLAAPAMAGKQRMTGEEKLAKELEGRVAGEPQRCLPYAASSDMKVIDKTAIVYGRGNTIWVNRPVNARSLDDDDILVRKSYTPQVCNLDIVHTMDRGSRMYTGTIGLGDFVPYRKVAVAD